MCHTREHKSCGLSSIQGTSNVTGRHRGPKRKLRAGYRAPSRHASPMCRQSLCLPIGLCNVRHMFHRRVLYHALSLRYACIQSSGSGIILIPYAIPLCQISFLSRPPYAELAFKEKSRTVLQSITQLIRCAGNRSFRFGTSCQCQRWRSNVPNFNRF